MPIDWTEVEQLLQWTQRHSESRISNELARIEEQLEQRDAIHDSLVSELESKIEWYADRLQTLYKQSSGRPSKQDELKDRLVELYEQLRDERRQHWQDKQRLERDRRDVLRELDSIDEIDDIRNIL